MRTPLRPAAVGAVLALLGSPWLVGCTSGKSAQTPISSVIPPVTAGASTGGRSAAPSGSASTRATGGDEGTTGPSSPNCEITSAATVTAAYRGKIIRATSGTSGTGSQLCQFTLSSSNVGSGGAVSLSMNRSVDVAAFRTVKAQTSGAESVGGLGDEAFYVPGSGTLQFIKGKTLIVIQASLKRPNGPQPRPAQLRSDSLVLARAIAAQI